VRSNSGSLAAASVFAEQSSFADPAQPTIPNWQRVICSTPPPADWHAKVSILTGTPAVVRARSEPGLEASWRREMQLAIRSARQLGEALNLPPEWAAEGAQAERDFSVFVPPSYLSRIRPGDSGDPLLLQVLPNSAERLRPEGFTTDPVGDAAARLAPGLLHKYSGRVLLIVTGNCAVHCRYCFRRHFPYEESPRTETDWGPTIDAIAADPSIREVIFSGGDPLTLSDRRLATLATRIAGVPHIARLRVHTRLPIMIPSRVTDELLQWLTGSRLSSVLVLHANHARELDESVAAAVQRLRQAGVLLLNQAVLLRGVNDSVDALIGLSERLVDIGVTPYYLHQLDRVAGAAHFEVSQQRGRALIDQLRRRLPGYMVPRYVREEPGALSKTPL